MIYNPRLQFGGQGRHSGRPSPTPRKRKRTQRDQDRRTLSQNFLDDPRALRQVVRAAVRCPLPPLVVEVGAGDGRLTVHLADHAERLVAHEIDPVLAVRLRARCQELEHVRCVLGDFLRTGPPNEPFAVVGNIPYAVTSQIVDWCRNAPRLTSATLLTQWEYARKRTGDYGRWTQVTVESWPWFSWELGPRVDRWAFRPVPRVDSGVLRLERRAKPLLAPSVQHDYRRFVAVGFGGVGGSLHASLGRRYPRARVDDAFRLAGLARDTVVAFVPPDTWATLYSLVCGER